MKLQSVSLAVALALSAGTAHALLPAEPHDIEIFMGGATAQDINIEQLFTEFCLPGTLDVYRDPGAPAAPTIPPAAIKPGPAHNAFFCQLDSAQIPGLSVNNPRVLFHKRSAGGSGIGVNPLIDASPVAHMSIRNGNCTETSAGSKEWRCTTANAGDTVSVIQNAGVSDVDPGLFRGPNTPAGTLPVNPTDVANFLDVSSAAALVFNTPVSLNLRNALQEAQFGLGHACVGQNSEACMPSLSRAQIASLLTGRVSNWNRFFVNGTALTSVASALPSSTRVTVCRRVNGSGTQAQANAKFLQAPCTPGVVGPATEPGNPISGPVIRENSGSGDVDKCLADFNNGANTSGENASLATAWAIGVQSTERNTTLSVNYRFIKIDGKAPTIQNAANGSYFDWVELTFQRPKAGRPGAPNADQLKILQKIESDASKPAIIAANNVAFIHPWGQGGYLALTTNGHTPAANGVFSLANPTTPYTHVAGGATDNCRVPVLLSGDNAALDQEFRCPSDDPGICP